MQRGSMSKWGGRLGFPPCGLAGKRVVHQWSQAPVLSLPTGGKINTAATSCFLSHLMIFPEALL